jgi:hypothetical protein
MPPVLCELDQRRRDSAREHSSLGSRKKFTKKITTAVKVEHDMVISSYYIDTFK